MPSKSQDLMTVLAGASTRGLLLLQKGLREGIVVRGVFVDEDDCSGCIVYQLSEHQVSSREALVQWVRDRWHVPGVEDACKRLMVGWDAGDPPKIEKGRGYDSFYPKASYVLTAEEIFAAIDEVLVARTPQPRRQYDVRRGGKILLI